MFMNPQGLEDLVTSSVFERLPKDTQQFILNAMSGLGEIASTEGTIASTGAVLEVISMETPASMPTTSRSPRLKPTPVRENPKPKKENKKRPILVCESPRKHFSTQAQKKDKLSTKDKGKVVDLEAEEGTEDINAEGMQPISKLSDYISLCKGKV